jgi:hypothetical protein
MPFLPNPIPILVVKIVGYSIAGFVLQKTYQSRFHFLLFAVVRIFAGLLVGLFTLLLFAKYFKDQNYYFILWLILVRLIVWGIVIKLIFERTNFSLARFCLAVFLGILWSFFMDGIIYALEQKFPDFMQLPFC